MHEIGGFNLTYMQSHDFDYWIRIAKKYPLYVMQERLLAMRRFVHENSEGENNSKTSGSNVIRYENEAVNIKKHFLKIWKMNFLSEHSVRIFEIKNEKQKKNWHVRKCFFFVKHVRNCRICCLRDLTTFLRCIRNVQKL